MNGSPFLQRLVPITRSTVAFLMSFSKAIGVFSSQLYNRSYRFFGCTSLRTYFRSEGSEIWMNNGQVRGQSFQQYELTPITSLEKRDKKYQSQEDGSIFRSSNYSPPRKLQESPVRKMLNGTVLKPVNSSVAPWPTIPPNEIDANTIRYPFRPAPRIPLLKFAPLPPGVTVPYPPLLQWPTSKPSTAMSTLKNSTVPPLPSSNTSLPAGPKKGPLLSFDQGNPPNLRSSDIYFGDLEKSRDGSSDVTSAAKDFERDVQTINNHKYFQRLQNPLEFSGNDEFPQENQKDVREANFMKDRFLEKAHTNVLQSGISSLLPHFSSARFRVRKRRDIFFEDAFKNFEMTWKARREAQVEPIKAQFQETPNGNLVLDLDYRKKLEKDLEKYVEQYVEQQINQGEIDTRKPKTTVIELKTKEGPPIKTVTTTVSKIIEGDKPLLESILEFSKSINPVSDIGEFSGGVPVAETSEQSEVSKAFNDEEFGSFDWNLPW